MYDSIDRLKKQLLPGEDSTFEIKDVNCKGNTISSPHRNSMADELAAMANTNGGVVVPDIVFEAIVNAAVHRDYSIIWFKNTVICFFRPAGTVFTRNNPQYDDYREHALAPVFTERTIKLPVGPL